MQRDGTGAMDKFTTGCRRRQNTHADRRRWRGFRAVPTVAAQSRSTVPLPRVQGQVAGAAHSRAGELARFINMIRCSGSTTRSTLRV
jgi:hypothetical protein